MYKEKDIMYELGKHWVLKTNEGTYEVYKNGATCATRCGIVGIKGDKGLQHAIGECNKRETGKR